MYDLQIRDLIQQDFTTISMESSIGEAESTLLQSQATVLYVVDDSNRLTGLVADYDLLKYTWLGLNRDNSISSLSSPISIALTCNDSLETLVQILSHHIHPQIPVIECGQLLGTIDRLAAIRAIAEKRDAVLKQSNYVVKSDGVIPAPKFAITGKNRNSEKVDSPHNR